MSTTIDDILDVKLDLHEVTFQLDCLLDFIKHLEHHLEWPKKVELQQTRALHDQGVAISEQERIEHKYRVLLPTRQRYSYAAQLCSIIEWSCKNIVEKNNLGPEYEKFRVDRGYRHATFRNRIEFLEQQLGIPISNRDKIYELYTFRNEVIHSYGIIQPAEKHKWLNSSLYSVIEYPGEIYLTLNFESFIECLLETKEWIIKMISVPDK